MEVQFRSFAAKKSENKICVFVYFIYNWKSVGTKVNGLLRYTDSKYLPKTNFRVIGTLNKDQKSNDCSVSNNCSEQTQSASIYITAVFW